jgi:hypothetical protein
MADPASLLIMGVIAEDIKSFSYMRGVDFDPRFKPLVTPPSAKVLKTGEPLLQDSPFVIRDYQLELTLYFSGIKEVTLDNHPERYVQPIVAHFGGEEANFPFLGVTPNKNGRVAFKVLDALFLGKNVKTCELTYLVQMSIPVAPERFSICNKNEEF